MLDTSRVKLKDIYKVLYALKTNKYITRVELAIKVNLNVVYVTQAIKYLNENGYDIEVVQGANGGYIYHGKKRKIIVERKNKKINKGICALYNNDKITIREIQEITNRSKPAIYYQLNKNKIKLYKKPRKYNAEDIKKMYKEGISIKEISKKFNISYKTASSMLYRFVQGTRRHKINNREEIKQYIVNNKNITGKEIAKKFNVSEATITHLKNELKGIGRK